MNTKSQIKLAGRKHGFSNAPCSASETLKFITSEISEESLFEFLTWISAISVSSMTEAEYVATHDPDAAGWVDLTFRILWKSSPQNTELNHE